jgi:hypothetical protein
MSVDRDEVGSKNLYAADWKVDGLS